MDDFNFVIEGDILFRNEISATEQQNVFTVRKVPVINKETFLACMDMWVKSKEEEK